MALTLPELDDRLYDDLTEEARSLLVTFAPSLTNHNPSDPLVTLTELFAYFTEILLFRLNIVTDANRTAFLKLLNGPTWTLPASSDLDTEIRRTVVALRTVDRAITASDYESLALSADPAGNIVRALCVPGFDLTPDDPIARATPTPGTVSVVIVPAAGATLSALIPLVANFIEPRRLLTTKVRVVGPRTVPIRVRASVHLLPDAPINSMSARVTDALNGFLDPLTGRDGNGWPFGRNVNTSEIYRLLDSLPGVDFVTRSLSPSTGAELDELVTTSAFADRVRRNDAGELISIALNLDELVLPQIVATDIDIQPAPSVA